MSNTVWNDYAREIAEAREIANLDPREERYGEGVPSENEIRKEEEEQRHVDN